MKEVIFLAFTLPPIPVIGVVRRNDHDMALLIEDRANVHLRAIFPAALLSRVTFPSHAIIFAFAALPCVRRLQFVLWNPQIKDAMKNGMIHRQFHKLVFGQHALDFAMKTLPLPLSPKIVCHENSAVEQVFSQNGNLLITQQQAARLDHVNPRVIEQVGVAQPNYPASRIDLQ